MRPIWPSSQFHASQQVSTILPVGVENAVREAIVSEMQPQPLDRVDIPWAG
jgi:hypothetical protein